MNLKQLSKEDRREMSLIEVAYAIFKEQKQPLAFQELLERIQQFMELSDAELKQRMAQFYTDLNIDGRFIVLDESRWGLRKWYPIDQLEEEVVPTVKSKKKKTKKAPKEEPEFEEDVDEADEELDFDVGDIDELNDELDLDEDEDIDEFDEEEEEFDGDLVTEDDYDLDEDEEKEQK
ncbi:DNA-directed RNA polymerase subunit delta [Bacillus xiapuensis]|uniref:DNA-directed RNA polymerase subunit delta n=1 Tax=Bacillus xiapuensis TaxID=2014075 RepID=UPI000C24F63D|nr:DNA-directed RNA polymerase subunit delta [Bacillus xiapuensis]